MPMSNFIFEITKELIGTMLRVTAIKLRDSSFPRWRESSGLFNMPFDLVIAEQGIFILPNSRLRGNDVVIVIEVSLT